MNWSIIIVMPLPALIMAVTVSFSRPVSLVSAITVFMCSFKDDSLVRFDLNTINDDRLTGTGSLPDRDRITGPDRHILQFLPFPVHLDLLDPYMRSERFLQYPLDNARMDHLAHAVCGKEPLSESHHGFIPYGLGDSFERDLMVRPYVMNLRALSANSRSDCMAGKDPGHRIHRQDAEHVLDWAAGYDRASPDNISGHDLPPLDEIDPERLDKPAGRRFGRERFHHKIIIEPGYINVRRNGGGQHPVCTGLARVVRAVPEILLPLPC
jgi:hypothetical protein